MHYKTVKITIISLILGGYPALHDYFLSGISPVLNTISKILLLGFFLYAIRLVFIEVNRRTKVVQIVILLISILAGLIVANVISKKHDEDLPRKYHMTEDP